MLIRLAVLMILVPVFEISVLIQTETIIGLPWTIVLIIATGTTGAMMLRQEGFSTLNRIQDALARGEVPAMEIIDGVLLLTGGLLLLTPGLLTDLCGFILLSPWPRKRINARLQSWLRQRIEKGDVFAFPFKNR